MLVISDGSYDKNETPETEKQTLENMGVTIYAMYTGVWNNTYNVKALASNKDFYGNENDWVKVIYNTKPMLGNYFLFFRSIFHASI